MEQRTAWSPSGYPTLPTSTHGTHEVIQFGLRVGGHDERYRRFLCRRTGRLQRGWRAILPVCRDQSPAQALASADDVWSRATMDTYSHVSSNIQREAFGRLGERLKGYQEGL